MNHPFPISVPHLETERLNLREYRREDFDLFADHLMNSESSVHLGPADRQTAWRIFSSHIASGNDSSRRVADRLGMAYEMEVDLYGNSINSYMRERN